MASTLKINTLTGVSTAGSIAVTGEGNSTTTNLQQGLGKSWINAMEMNLNNMEANLNEKDKIKHKVDIQNNRDHLNSLKNKNSSEWREYATKCMIEIMENKDK